MRSEKRLALSARLLAHLSLTYLESSNGREMQVLQCLSLYEDLFIKAKENHLPSRKGERTLKANCNT